MPPTRAIKDVLSDYFNLCELSSEDQRRLVLLAEGILAHHANGWPEHTYENGDLEL